MSNHQQNSTGISVSDEIDAIARYLTDGFYEWDETQDPEAYGGRRAFDVQPGGSLTADITKLTPAGQQLARWALEAWTNVTGIRFALVEDENANITFDDNEEGAFAYSTHSDSDGGVIISSHVNVEVLEGDATGMDSELFVTYLHETGHALGLGHPGPYPPDTEPVFADFTVFRHDSATGGEGNDVLKAGPGEDIIIVDGDDMDVLYGGPDKDTFRFFPSDLGGGSIGDFSDGEDVIDLTEFTGINSIDDLDLVSYGDNVRIEVSGTDYLTTIILSDFEVNNLDAADFIFVS